MPLIKTQTLHTAARQPLARFKLAWQSRHTAARGYGDWLDCTTAQAVLADATRRYGRDIYHWLVQQETTAAPSPLYFQQVRGMRAPERGATCRTGSALDRAQLLG